MVTKFSALLSVLALFVISKNDNEDSPWFDQLGDGEQRPEDEAKTPNDDVRYTKEWVPTSHYRSSRNENGFCPVVYVDWKV